MHILVINGPNLNLLGHREVEVYGNATYDALELFLHAEAKKLNVALTIHQTNYEGAVLDLLHHAEAQGFDGVVLNAAAYSHYSYAIQDGVKAIALPVVNVHLTDPAARQETFRHTDVLEAVCVATVKGKGFASYADALSLLVKDVIR